MWSKKVIILYFYFTGVVLIILINLTRLSFSNTEDIIKVLTPFEQYPILYERMHFIVKIPDLHVSDMLLEVHNNNVFEKQIDLQDAHYTRGLYYFHFFLCLNMGSNKVTLRLVTATNAIIAEKNLHFSYGEVPGTSTIIDIGNTPIIWYAPSQDTDKSQLAYTFHSPYQELVCKQCHELTGLGKDGIGSECNIQNQCKCHRAMFNQQNRYLKMTGSFECSKCHTVEQRKGSGFKKLSSEFCISCHQKRGFFLQENLHEPLEYGECWICHRLHTGKRKHLLIRNVNEICISCHAGRHEGKVYVNNHPILYGLNNWLFNGREYKCTDCHDPHSAQLLCDTKGPDEPCKRCHSGY